MSEGNVSSRIEQYKANSKTWIAQEKRRYDLLQDQERKREELLDKHRKIVDALNKTPKSDSHSRRDVSLKSLGSLLMLSEWLLRPPEDFETTWVFMFCPKGRRCIIHAQNGRTMAISKRGQILANFESYLPGGGSANSSSTTMLDCIYCENSKYFYILDALQWGDIALVGTDMECRQFWIKSRLEDIPPTRGEKPRYSFQHLETYSCSDVELAYRLSEYPVYPNPKCKVDGILFYHREGLYTKGSTPLVGWLKPFMLTEVLRLNFPVAKEFYEDCPENYTSFEQYINEFEENLKRKTKKVHKMDIENLEDTLPEDGESMDSYHKEDEDEKHYLEISRSNVMKDCF